MTQYILGIDNGGTVSKAAIHAPEGPAIVTASKSISTIVPAPGWSERNMQDLWNANVAVVREAVEKSGVDPADIVGIVLTGHGNGLYLVDEFGRPVRNGIVSNDSRAQYIVDRWNADGSFKERCQPVTMQSLFAGGPLPILAWLAENEPGVMEQTHHIFMVKDYIRYMMTGNANFEVTDASCTDLYDMQNHELHDSVFAKMGAGAWEGKLPPLINSMDIGGRLLPAVAAATGLVAGTPVIAGCSDISASPIGSGVVGDEELSVVTGTWSINSYFSTSPILDEQLFMTSIAPLPDRYLITEASPTSAANLEWFIHNVLRQIPALADASSAELYELCNSLAFSVKEGDSNVTFTPFIFGSNLHPHVNGGFAGLTNADGLPQLLHSIYEGVAYSHREHIERLRTYTTLKPNGRITGGVTKSPRWSQMFADVLRMDLEKVDVAESGILGAVIVAATALGIHPSMKEAAAAMVPAASTVQAAPDADFEDAYERWKSVVSNAERVTTGGNS
ncbi:FGGY-family carbohydrate kinase [Actinomycetaceae bacterium L2_0104]